MAIERTHTISIDRDWLGAPAPTNECARASLAIRRDGFEVRVDAPLHEDPVPPGPPRSLDGLWRYEVVELFLLGVDERYLEIELSPHGHHLVLVLHGRRRIVSTVRDVLFAAERERGRWRGSAQLPLDRLPPGLRAWNAYAIHGSGAARRYLAAAPVPGAQPDFHRLEDFAPLRV
jgi:hypothetical protein